MKIYLKRAKLVVKSVLVVYANFRIDTHVSDTRGRMSKLRLILHFLSLFCAQEQELVAICVELSSKQNNSCWAFMGPDTRQI